MLTFGQLKFNVRQIIFASGEASNLVTAHDKMFVDCLIDLQTWVPCLQQDNTLIKPQCSTLFNCGLTVFDAPRGAIKKLSVIDKLNQTTGQEDPAVDIDWCSEIEYSQVEPCHIQKYLSAAARLHCCPSIPFFFALSVGSCGFAGSFPPPTDEGVDPSLPKLPLGYHYPQTSTDAKHGRARAGRWAIERGKIYVAPWIQSTESVLLKWDGIKRTWGDSDPIDDDPLLSEAVQNYVEWKHNAGPGRDPEQASTAAIAYTDSRQKLWHQCQEENRVRRCEPSYARSATVTTLYYNDAQQATAECGPGQAGNPVTVTIPAGTVSSSISVADANTTAQAQAQAQAQGQLVCSTAPVTFTNDQQSATASCQASPDSPIPDGNPVTVTIPAGQFTSNISKDDANNQALAAAQAQAQAQLVCTFWNAEQTFTAQCPSGTTGSDVTKTTAAHTFSSGISQDQADSLALNDAKTRAQAELSCTDTVTYLNTQQGPISITRSGCQISGGPPCVVVIQVTVTAGRFSSTTSQGDANLQATQFALKYATDVATAYCAAHKCGHFSFTI